MNFLKLLIVLFVSITFSALAMSSDSKFLPQKIVTNFISDYEEWNGEATKNLSEDTAFQTKDEYIKLLNKYCTQSESRIGYDIYGQYSLHFIGGGEIISTKENNKEIVIKTGVPSRFGGAGTDMDYFEYHLVLDKNKHLIEEVYQLSKSGKRTKAL